VDRAAIEAAARDAQAHDFIMTFKDGYDTVLGEPVSHSRAGNASV